MEYYTVQYNTIYNTFLYLFWDTIEKASIFISGYTNKVSWEEKMSPHLLTDSAL